jgi:hypothetical protein
MAAVYRKGFFGKIIAVTVLLQASACSFHEQKLAPGESGSSAQDLNSFDALNSTIFQPQCAHCHSGSGASGGVDLSSYQTIKANSGLIVAGDPKSSKIYTEVESGDMPDGGSPLTAVEVQAIGDWILAGAPDGSFTYVQPTQPPGPATPPANPPPPQPPKSATFTEVRAQIFAPLCVRCHAGAHPSGQVDLTSYQNIMANAKKLAVPGDASHSLLYTEIDGGSMPLRGPKLSSALIQLMGDWIAGGAKNN